MKIRSPSFNDTPSAVALREAALDFAKRASEPIRDSADTDGQRRNKALLDAALAYAAGCPCPVIQVPDLLVALRAKRSYFDGCTGTGRRRLREGLDYAIDIVKAIQRKQRRKVRGRR